MRRVLFIGSLLLVFTLAIGTAQPPAPIPAAPPTGETALAQFEPLSSFPQATQTAVRSAIHGSNWLTRMNGRLPTGSMPCWLKCSSRRTSHSEHSRPE